MGFRVDFRVFVILCLLILSSPVLAGAGDDIQDFWDSWSTNATGPSSFRGQAASYYSAGNLRARTEIRTTQLATLTGPRISAGCGGIDIFAGAFSFVEADQLVQLSKNIAANATGYAFELALETVCPVCAETMSKQRDLQQKINAMNINSCETAQNLVNSVWMKDTSHRSYLCKSVSSNKGLFSDYAASRHGCQNDASVTSAESQADDAAQKQNPLKNYAWEVIRGDGQGSNDWAKLDDDIAEFAMTITGTFIVSDNDGDGATERVFYAGAADKEGLVKWLQEGGSFKVLQCNEPAACMEVTKTNITLGTDQSFKARVANHIDALKTAIENDTVPSAADIAFINSVDVPIYRILNLYNLGDVAIIDVEKDNLVKIVTEDFTYGYLIELTQELLKRNVAHISTTDEYKQWRADLRAMQAYLAKQRGSNIKERMQTIKTLFERAELIEAQAASRFGAAQMSQIRVR